MKFQNNSTAKYLIRTAIFTYCFIGILAFGNAVTFFEARGAVKSAECMQTVAARDVSYCVSHQSTGVAAVFSTFFWPFYVSYRIAQSN